jgi:hypothetical protein
VTTRPVPEITARVLYHFPERIPMSRRAKEFVESFIVEYEAPVSHEADDLTESKAFAASCYASAAIEGISKAEIDEEYEDLVAEFASSHESMVNDEITAEVPEDD